MAQTYASAFVENSNYLIYAFKHIKAFGAQFIMIP